MTTTATSSFTVVDDQHADAITCAVCLQPWTAPIELLPCRHVFCVTCCQGQRRCPLCRVDVTSAVSPNRILVNMSQDVQMRCDHCAWTGPHAMCRAHVCSPPPTEMTTSTRGRSLSPSSKHKKEKRALHHHRRTATVVQPPHDPRPKNRDNNTTTVVIHAPAVPLAAPRVAINAPQSLFGTEQRPATHHQHMVVQQQQQQPWRQYNLSQEEFDHIFAVFLSFDTDRSGALDRAELNVLCRWLNFAHTQRDVDRMFAEIDTDGDGTLTFEEFCSYLSTHRPDPTKLYGLSMVEYNQVLFQFHGYDDDHNGYLDEEEFIGLCISQGYCPDSAIGRRLFREVDVDNSGYVDLHELLLFRSRGKMATMNHHHHEQQRRASSYQPNPRRDQAPHQATTYNTKFHDPITTEWVPTTGWPPATSAASAKNQKKKKNKDDDDDAQCCVIQ